MGGECLSGDDAALDPSAAARQVDEYVTRSRADARGVRASSAASHPGVRAACRARTVKEFMRPEPLADDEDPGSRWDSGLS